MEEPQAKEKKRILLVSEFSLLNTGFSVMAHEILKRLHDSGKYVVAELASYVHDDDPRIYTLPWTVFPAAPAKSDRIGMEDYQKNYQTAQFGSLRFDNVVLDFKPDIVFSYRDFWHDEFITKSPYRHLFYYIWSTCVDSEPPRESWLDVFSKVDLLSSYSVWGLNVLKKYGGEGWLNIAPTDTMPGVDIDTFRPMDKKAIRDKYGLKEDINIIMKCARNQMRKLYPDLIRSFMVMMDQLYQNGEKTLADKTYLYLHTSLNDVGFDLIKEVKKYNASHKVLLTYMCNQCFHVFPSFLQGRETYCPSCQRLSALTPNTSVGVSREVLAEIYNLADLYCQVQVAGACEIPILEARSAGVPTLAVDYAAPRELQSLPGSAGLIKIGLYRQESLRETEQFRAYVDEPDLVKQMTKFLKLPQERKDELSKLQRETAEKYHSFDLTTEKWMSLFDASPDYDPERWTKKPQLITVDPQRIPWKLPNQQFVRWCCTHLIPPDHPYSGFQFEKNMIKKLSVGWHKVNDKLEQYDRKKLVEEILGIVQHWNHFESHRYNRLILQPKRKAENKINYKVY